MSKKGFTLIEMLIVVVIISSIISLGSIGYKLNSNTTGLAFFGCDHIVRSGINIKCYGDASTDKYRSFLYRNDIYKLNEGTQYLVRGNLIYDPASGFSQVYAIILE